MYDVLFIDDHFKEIHDTFFSLQDEYIRCFYSDGEKYLPANKDASLPFKNLKYICLDLHLENRGISSFDKSAASTLVGLVKKFTDNKDVGIIISTSFPGEFKKHRADFIRYLGWSKPKITVAEKDGAKFSSIHNIDIKNDIIEGSYQSILRNLVIREAIEIENLIWDKILSSKILERRKEKNDISKKSEFHKKIEVYCSNINKDENLKTNLTTLRETRNEFAHSDNLPKKHLLKFLGTKILACDNLSKKHLLKFLSKIEILKKEINEH